MSRPDADAPDQSAGKSALADLKREAKAAQVLIDPEKARSDARRAASQRKLAAVDVRRTAAKPGTFPAIMLAMLFHAECGAGLSRERCFRCLD